jgi:hypothetical protein
MTRAGCFQFSGDDKVKGSSVFCPYCHPAKSSKAARILEYLPSQLAQNEYGISSFLDDLFLRLFAIFAAWKMPAESLRREARSKRAEAILGAPVPAGRSRGQGRDR